MTVGIAAAAATAGCASGPSTEVEVCAAYNELSVQPLRGSGVLSNPLFKAVESLADKAGASEGGGSVAAAADRLHEIADADSTSIGESEDASAAFGHLCGGSLTLRALTGR